MMPIRIHLIASKVFVKENTHISKCLVREIRNDAQITTDWVKTVVKHIDRNSQEDAVRIYEDEVRFIRESDGVVAEVSNRSVGVGFQISYALANKKPVLCLYNRLIGSEKVSKLLTGSSERMLFIEDYDPEEPSSLTNPIKAFIEKIGGLNLVKFNFIATAEIKHYIEKGSQQRGISQSEFLREKIEEMMAKDTKHRKLYE